MEGRQFNGAVGGLAQFDTLGGWLKAVIGRVAHHVGQRIADQLQHLAIKFGAFTVHHEVDLLTQFVRQIAHQTG